MTLQDCTTSELFIVVETTFNEWIVSEGANNINFFMNLKERIENLKPQSHNPGYT